MRDSLCVGRAVEKNGVRQSLDALGSLKALMGQKREQDIVRFGKMGGRSYNLECSPHCEEPLTHIR